jgi:molybdenum cofactor synthesis domain-containing protein
MPSAEIIIIGTEILLGEIVDTNAQYVARCLRDAGVDLYRKTTVGDNPRRIAQAIQQAMERCDIILTTGGLGPTVDDPTREAIALGVGVDVEYRPELWDQIQARFARYGRTPTENNKKQAYIPQGAIAVENPVGTAPSFIVERGEKCIFALPGVPSEMEFTIYINGKGLVTVLCTPSKLNCLVLAFCTPRESYRAWATWPACGCVRKTRWPM